MQNLKIGDSVIRSIRKINKVKGEPAKGQNYQIEVAHQRAEKSILSLFLPSDTRINQGKPQVAFRAIEPEVFNDLFGASVSAETLAKLDKLALSTGMKASDMVEDVHFVRLEILNPTVQGSKLGVQVIETLTPPNAQAKPKINPTTGVVVTSGGQPVYRETTVEFNPVYKTLPSDRVEPVQAAIQEAFQAAMKPNPLVAGMGS